MIQEQLSCQIYTDYNIGMRTNLADRDIYKPQPDSKKEEITEKMKYILSNKDTYDPYEGQNKVKLSKKIIIPSKFIAHDKIHRYGGKIEDPFKVNTDYKDELKQRVFTSAPHQKNPQKK